MKGEREKCADEASSMRKHGVAASSVFFVGLGEIRERCRGGGGGKGVGRDGGVLF